MEPRVVFWTNLYPGSGCIVRAPDFVQVKKHLTTYPSPLLRLLLYGHELRTSVFLMEFFLP